MYHRLFILAIFWLSIGAAQAQSPAAIDWSGFYLGGSAGGTFGRAHAATSVASRGTYFQLPSVDQIAEAGEGDVALWRPSFGLQSGYGQQFGNVFLALEASANTLFIDDARSRSVPYAVAPATGFKVDQSVEAHWMATLRPRLGWAEDRWLAYVTGGLAVTRLSLEATFSDNNTNAFSQDRIDETKVGWTAGIGGEIALDENWSIRTEYLYARFGSLSSVSELTMPIGLTAQFDHSAGFETHSALIGLTYRFGGP